MRDSVSEYDVTAGNGYCTNAELSPKVPVSEQLHVLVVVCGTGLKCIARARLEGPWGNRRRGESRKQWIAGGVYVVNLPRAVDA